MCRSARLYNCACCHCQVIICSHCDRGNHYCSGECAVQSRLNKQRVAGSRYQSSAKGRHLHARRQQRYRQRQKEKVTHQCSPELTPYDLLLVEPKTVTTRIKKWPLAERSRFYCHFCGCRCSEQLRWAFLYRQDRHSLPVHTL
ncbi:MAG: hypothetical protein KAJ63_15510 [Methyloprofundus sp.]|nr:hypothetical protein [Methyloprofundus sp.]